MRVDLGRCDRRVAGDLLDDPNVLRPLVESGQVRVAEKVEVDPLLDPSLLRFVLDHPAHIRRLDISSRECREYESLWSAIESLGEVDLLAQDLGADE